ncbi:MAG TPA: DUF2249 domain-containing protein, partial [Arenibacter sp.]|nr:DUF2249 domain-containing protein [Arenibacter sp.]
MKPINASTKLSHLIKAHPDALEVITGIDPKLHKFRNPLLRKALAGRTTLAMAAKIVNCDIAILYDKFRPLGFEIDGMPLNVKAEKKELPHFILSLAQDQIVDFDVRELLASGKDPLTLILGKVNSLPSGKALKVINTFEPVPLIIMLEKQGFRVYVDTISDDLVETYFYKKSEETNVKLEPAEHIGDGWEDILQRFDNKLVNVDVRSLEMPQPMLAILGELDKLPADMALHVYHKRIPVFLLP